ncbi:3-hydroxy-3-methylglutaryl-ACP synthase [Actinomadura darangshiensis]|uniref:3-hydroxy-3-methylglutaryl-ACP synthase n=1 Tax=Actinomadura darangshiensis TaxID=705336 RepID=A0A4R5C4C3_9ACTN|nr:hydroxymethylglutaryl-CoA synthase [Actinomadura darangshiensis]TDD92923.1 3-hydroxy-3-methylglutaryl-ACP synthase [Actinomadura darangshiensis]
MQVDIGIDDLNVYGSTLVIDAADIAAVRGTPMKRLTQWRLDSRSLVPPYEDPVTLAVNAARPLVDEHGASDFGLLLVASESGLDYSKPLSSYVHEFLGLPGRCVHSEIKHACFGGTAALLLAADWVRANPHAKALVVTTDLSRRLFGHAAESAEGMGATALAVSAEPRVLGLDAARGFASKEIYDVARPTHIHTVVDSELSLSAYLDLAEIAWSDYRRQDGAAAYDDLDHLAFHTPLAPLVQQAHLLFAEESSADVPPAEQFERKVAPSLRYCQKIGNTFSGCLFVALAGLIDDAPDADTGRRIGLYSYGSGSSAAFFSGVLRPGARARLARHDISSALTARRRVDVRTYERLVEDLEQSLTAEDFEPDTGAIVNHFEESYAGRNALVLSGVKGYQRSYQWS